MKFTESTSAELLKYMMLKSAQPIKVRHCIFPVLTCLMLHEHILLYTVIIIFAG
jgi:hypothetical protein